MIVLYPTDTIYGLGVDATDATAVRALRALKGSGGEKHYAIAVSDINMMRQYTEVTLLAEKLIATFLPGKLTLILKSKGLPIELSDDDTIGIRIPNHSVVMELIAELGKPITCTSANKSGLKTQNSVPDILAQFGTDAQFITRVVDGGVLPPSEPSTVVDARGAVPKVIRVGAIPEVAIQGTVV